MFKLGIVSYPQLDRPLTFLGKRRFASLLLLRDLFERSPRNPEHYDTIIRLLLMPNGTWKDTLKGRFAVLDRIVLEVLQSRYAPGSRLTVTDLGVSTGTTSVEFYEVLRSAFSVDFLATDGWRDAVAIRSRRLGWTVVFDSDGRELQYVAGPFVLPGQGQESVLYPVNRALRQLCRWLALPAAHSIFERYDRSRHADFETTVIDGYDAIKLPLLSIECLDLAAQSADFRFEVCDIMDPIERRADVIRAMNLITPFHFDAARLRRAIGNCLAALNPRGTLIIGRSPTDDPGSVKATIYCRNGDTLSALKRVNGGSEVEHLVNEQYAVLNDTPHRIVVGAHS